MDIYQLLDSVEPFELSVQGHRVTVRRNAADGWLVYLQPDSTLIGSFFEETRDRATFYVSEIAGEPGTVNWVSDDVTTLISRMLTLRD